ncbi:MAG: hypothetical protein CMJ32_05615 [Phycisphaerae bacterium]|nr:hypothetical protein [Phycisphaerae bacterium]
MSYISHKWAVPAVLLLCAPVLLALSSDCFEPHPWTGCDDQECTSVVCQVNPLCCELEWDQDCVEIAHELCGEPDECGSEGTGNCCIKNSTPFCEDDDCCTVVCAIDPFCCDTSWDLMCADRATEICAVCEDPETCEGDFNGDGIVDGTDLASLLSEWMMQSDMDLDGNGFINGADLGKLLNLWGPC